MSIVFVAGSRQISQIPAEVRGRLDTMIEKGFQILVGGRQRRRQGSPAVPCRQVVSERPLALHEGPLPEQRRELVDG